MNSLTPIQNNLTSAKQINHYLTSRVIAENVETGHYNFEDGLFLFYNEAFRRELRRMERSVEILDAIQYPWKAVAIHRWLSEYFLPVVKHHENNKRLYVVPFYKSLGYPVCTDTLLYEETFLSETFVDTISTTNMLCEAAFASEVSLEVVDNLVSNLKGITSKIKVTLENHYDAEERFWPNVLRASGGAEEWKKVAPQMAVNDKRQVNHIGELYCALVLQALGHDLSHASSDDLLDVPWCGLQTRRCMVSTLPHIVRLFPLPTWMNRCAYYKDMINTIAFSHDDPLELARLYRKKQALLVRVDLEQQRRARKRSSIVQFFNPFSGFNTSTTLTSDTHNFQDREQNIDKDGLAILDAIVSSDDVDSVITNRHQREMAKSYYRRLDAPSSSDKSTGPSTSNSSTARSHQPHINKVEEGPNQPASLAPTHQLPRQQSPEMNSNVPLNNTTKHKAVSKATSASVDVSMCWPWRSSVIKTYRASGQQIGGDYNGVLQRKPQPIIREKSADGTAASIQGEAVSLHQSTIVLSSPFQRTKSSSKVRPIDTDTTAGADTATAAATTDDNNSVMTTYLPDISMQ